MPERLPYDEAMMFSSVRLKIQDPEIKQGKVETIQVQTKLGPIERPWGLEGSFAVVYKFRTRSGQFRALRCFRVPMEPDTQFRYEQIGPYFHTHVNTITAGFKYHATGIVVKEQGQSQGQTYPIIEMDWVDGTILINKIDELCQNQDRIGLQALATQWVALIHTLRNARIAHGDLAGTNIMIGADGRMVLIDYDGVYIPSFAGKNPVLLGQPDYQHPQMAQRKFDEHMDAFSALTIYVILLALSIQPALWDTYMPRDDGKLLDNNLMFTQKDFQAPQQSPLFHALENLPDPNLKQLLQELKHACQIPADQVRFPFHLLDPDYDKKQALAKLKQALSTDDDEQIIQLWTPELTTYPDALVHLPRIQLAQQREAALAQFRAALQKGNAAQIVASYNPLLDHSKKISRTEHEQLARARHVQNALAQLKAALTDKNIAGIALRYDTILDGNTEITPDERSLITLARMFSSAKNAQNDEDLVKYYDIIQNSPHKASLLFTAEEELEVQQARKRCMIKKAFTQFVEILDHGNAQDIDAAYGNLPAEVRAQLSNEQRTRAESMATYIHSYQKLKKAIAAGNSREALRLYNILSMHPMLNLTKEEQLYIEGVKKAGQIEMAIRVRDDQQALKIARDLQRRGGAAGLSEMRSQLSEATRRLIQKHEVEAVKAFVQKEPRRNNYKLIFTWIWPKEELIRDAVIIYSPYQIPPIFREIHEVNCQYRGVVRKTQEREKQEAIPLEALYTGRANAAIYWRVCTLVRDEWENSLGKNKIAQYKHYLSPGISGQVYVTS